MDFPLKTIPGLAAAYITGLVLAAYAVTAGAPRNWAVTIPDVTHTYGIRLRGVDLFFRPAVGWYIEHGFWVCVAAIAATLTAEGIARAAGCGSAPPPDTTDDDPRSLLR